MAASASDAALSVLHCTICGDDASAFNFGALSCESCKAFFRRATRSSKVPTCVFSGDCVVSLRTRRFCAACRLRKCQTVGMNKCLVLSDEQRRMRQQTIAGNRLRRGSAQAGHFMLAHAGQQLLWQVTSLPSFTGSSRHLASIETPSIAVVDKKTFPLPPPFPLSVSSAQSMPFEQQLQQLGDQAASLVSKRDVSWSLASHQQPATASAACPEGGSAECVAGTTSNGGSAECVHGTTSSQLPKQIQCVMPSVALSFSQRQLSMQASDVLNVLTTLYKSKLAMSRRLSFRRSMDIAVTAETSLQWNRVAYHENRQQQFAARANDLLSGFVLFARELPDVTRLPVVAQLALIKACAPTFVLIRAVELYNEERTALIDELGDVVPTTAIDDLLSESRREPEAEFSNAATSCCRRFFEVVSIFRRLIPTNGPRGSPDRTTIALLQTIALLSPELLPSDLVSQDALDELANAQQRHVFQLRQHLESTCSFEDAALLCPKLLRTLEASKRDAIYVRDLLLSCSAVRRDDLLAEILDGRPAVGIATSSSAACATSKSPALPCPVMDAGSDPLLCLQNASGAKEQERGSLFSSGADIESVQSFCIFDENITDF